jgi:5-formyltetrahydrofolate cyclo-ligase
MTNGPPPADAAPHGTALRDAKLSLRRHLLARRDALDPESRIAAGTAIVGKIIALPSFVIARSVLADAAFRSEWDTLLRSDALATGRTVVVPRVNALTRMLGPSRGPDVRWGGHEIPAVAALPCPGICRSGLGASPASLRSRRQTRYCGGYYDRLLPLLSPRAGTLP